MLLKSTSLTDLFNFNIIDFNPFDILSYNYNSTSYDLYLIMLIYLL